MKVLVVDQHPVVRAGIAYALLDDPSAGIVGFAESGEGALAESERLQPDIVVMDIRLIGMSGVEACRLLKLKHVQAKIILMTSELTTGSVARALAAAPHGLVFKRSELEELKQAVKAVTEGMTYMDPRLQARMEVCGSDKRYGPFRLTPTEMRVLEYLAQGLTNAEIGEQIDVTTNTIKTHLKNAMHKLHAKDRAHAAAIAVREGLA